MAQFQGGILDGLVSDRKSDSIRIRYRAHSDPSVTLYECYERISGTGGDWQWTGTLDELLPKKNPNYLLLDATKEQWLEMGGGEGRGVKWSVWTCEGAECGR